MQLQASGVIQVQDRDFRVNLGYDFAQYYAWLVQRHYWIQLSGPLHGAHITVISEKFHNQSTVHLKKWHGKRIHFGYVPDLIVGGKTKPYRNFYVKIISPFLEMIRHNEGIKDNNILHITVANTKNVTPELWFPPLIDVAAAPRKAYTPRIK